MPIDRMNHRRAESDDENNHRNFGDNNRCVRPRALPNSVDQQNRQRENDNKGRQIDGN